MGKSLDNFLLGITLLWIFFSAGMKDLPKDTALSAILFLFFAHNFLPHNSTNKLIEELCPECDYTHSPV